MQDTYCLAWTQKARQESRPLGSKITNNENVVKFILIKCYAICGGKTAAL